MVTYQPAEVAGLSESERAFRLSTGELAVVAFTRRVAPEGWLCLNLDVRQINEDGTTAEHSGVPVVVPTKTISVPLSALASGAATVDQIRANHTGEAIERLSNYIAALKAWAQIPAAG